MNTPNGIRTESMRTPKASRAGALYSTLRHSKSGGASIHVYSLVPLSPLCRTRRMDALASLAGVRV